MHKRYLSLILALCLALSLTTGALATEETEEATEAAAYEVVIPLEYDKITYVSSEHSVFVTRDYENVWVMDENIETLRDLDGTELLQATRIWLWKDYIAVRQVSGWGLYDYDLNELIPCQYDEIGYLSVDYAVAAVNQTGEEEGSFPVYEHRYLVSLPDGEILEDWGEGTLSDRINWLEVALPDGSTATLLLNNGSFMPGIEMVSNDEWNSRWTYVGIFDGGPAIESARGRTILDLSSYMVNSVVSYGAGQYFRVLAMDADGNDLGYQLYSWDGTLVIPSGTFDSFYGYSGGITQWDGTGGSMPVDDPLLLLVTKDGKEGVIRLAEYSPQPDDWAAEEVAEAVANGYVAEETQWWWRDSCTRLEFCQILMAAVGDGNLESDISFSDCTDPDVLAAAALGIVTGYTDGTFQPDATITREEAAAMLARAAAYLGKAADGEAISFADANDISSWAAESVATVSALVDSDGNAVMGGTGNGNFSPKGSYTVEQAAVTVLRLTKCS